MKLRDKCYKSPRRTLRVAPLLQRGYKANGDFQKYAPFEKGGSRAAAGDFGSGERGITLLEIMFVMIIAAMITTAAFMYYGSVQRNQEINNAIQLIQQIITAVDNYRHPIDIEYIDGVPQSENAYKDYYEGLNTNVVANSGFIPQQYLQSGDSGEMEGLGITTPWFGTSSIRIDPYYQGSYAIAYQIILSEIPNYACSTLERQLKTMRDSNAHCDARQYEKVTCDENTLTLRTYPAGRMYCPATD